MFESLGATGLPGSTSVTQKEKGWHFRQGDHRPHSNTSCLLSGKNGKALIS